MDFILTLILVGVILILIFTIGIYRETPTTSRDEKHLYYILYISEKHKTCSPDYKSEFWYGKAQDLERHLYGKMVENIIKLD